MKILQYGHISLPSSVTRPDTLFQSPLVANSAVFTKRKFGEIWRKKFGDLSNFAKFAKLLSYTVCQNLVEIGSVAMKG